MHVRLLELETSTLPLPPGEKKSSAVEEVAGIKRSYLDEDDFCRFWQKRKKTSLDEATAEWDRRKSDEKEYPRKTCLETGELLIGTFTDMYDDAKQIKRNEANVELSLKEMKKPKDERIAAVESNLEHRASAEGITQDLCSLWGSLKSDSRFTDFPIFRFRPAHGAGGPILKPFRDHFRG
jgi:hypothetical protein